ncbi:MAG: MbnP family protein [bacterium]
MSLHSILARFVCLAALFAALSFVPDSESNASRTSVTLLFQNYVGNDLLKLDSVNYKNELGQTFNVTKFKYYIGNIRLKRTDGKEFVLDEYFLINQENENSGELLLNGVEPGVYSSVSFIIGVDSTRNCSGIQDGALDPLLGMFWAWNTGYVFLKIEGRSPQSKSTGNIIEYHVGGFKDPVNSIRNIDLKCKEYKLTVTEGKNSVVKIKTDISEIFKLPVSIDFSVLSSVTDLNNATLMAENYSDMFSITGIE